MHHTLHIKNNIYLHDEPASFLYNSLLQHRSINQNTQLIKMSSDTLFEQNNHSPPSPRHTGAESSSPSSTIPRAPSPDHRRNSHPLPPSFSDIYTLYGPYTTHASISSSPFYTQTEIGIYPLTYIPAAERPDKSTRIVHAAHPIPRATLLELGPWALHDLGCGLEEERWEVVRNEEFKQRVQETLERIDDSLEYGFGTVEIGARYLSGRKPKGAVERGLEERVRE